MSLAPALDLRGDPRDLERVPANVEAEQQLLGVLLYDNAGIEQITDKLQPKHFFEPFHGKLFGLIEEAAQAGRVSDPTTIHERLQADAAYNELGGVRYLADLIDRCGPTVTAKSYAALIYDLALRRELIRIGAEIGEQAKHQHDLDASEQIEVAEQALFNIAQQGAGQTGFEGIDHYTTLALEMAAEAYSRDGGLSGIPTGLVDLDARLGGLHASDLIILGARPSMGKSALAMNIARHAARQGVPTAVFSLEMSGEQLSLRLISEASGIPGDRVRRGEINATDFGRLRDAGDYVRGLPLHIDATGGLPISKLTTRARRLKRLKGIGLIIVDYLQLVSPASIKRERNRVQDVTEITQALKALAKDLNVPVLALSQLNRSLESREDKRPQLADLRESGSIEQDADVVMFLYREAYYLARQEPKEGSTERLDWDARMDEVRGLAEIIIAKQRHGPIGIAKVHWDENLTRFSNLAKEPPHVRYNPGDN